MTRKKNAYKRKPRKSKSKDKQSNICNLSNLRLQMLFFFFMFCFAFSPAQNATVPIVLLSLGAKCGSPVFCFAFSPVQNAAVSHHGLQRKQGVYPLSSAFVLEMGYFDSLKLEQLPL